MITEKTLKTPQTPQTILETLDISIQTHQPKQRAYPTFDDFVELAFELEKAQEVPFLSNTPENQNIKVQTEKESISQNQTSNGKLFLEYKENGKRIDSKYWKYNQKNIAGFAVVQGNTEEILKLKKQEKNSKKNKGFKKKLSFHKDLKAIGKSLCKCGKNLHFSNTSETVEVLENENGTRRIRGTMSCGNNASCPVCAFRLSVIRGNQLSELFTAGREHNRSHIMAVVTTQHQAGDSLKETLNEVVAMSRYIFNSRRWKKFREETGCRFAHGGLECTLSLINSKINWHPHKNYIFDFDWDLFEVAKRCGVSTQLELRMYISTMMFELGEKYLKKIKSKKKLQKPYTEEKDGKTNIKGAMSASCDFQDTYITKWGMGAEMTAGVQKKSDKFLKGLHPFQLLDMIDRENTEISEPMKRQCIEAFQEFVVAFRGKWWFYFGKGAVAFYNENFDTKIKVKDDVEELNSGEDDGADVLLTMDDIDWKFFEPNAKKIGIAFSQKTSADVVQFFLDEIEKNKSLILEQRLLLEQKYSAKDIENTIERDEVYQANIELKKIREKRNNDKIKNASFNSIGKEKTPSLFDPVVEKKQFVEIFLPEPELEIMYF